VCTSRAKKIGLMLSWCSEGNKLNGGEQKTGKQRKDAETTDE